MERKEGKQKKTNKQIKERKLLKDESTWDFRVLLLAFVLFSTLFQLLHNPKLSLFYLFQDRNEVDDTSEGRGNH